ncbi:uncharacterized protein [Clinocottus analis]|uniref:uncharacterized protein n=1 Tax=Clinocottus analis TaxID=304258 RepID=UPI0035C11163
MTVKGDTVKDDTVKDDTVKDHTVKYDTDKDDTVKGDTVKGDTVKDDTVKDGTVKDHTVKYDTVKDDTVKDDTVKDDTVKDDIGGGGGVVVGRAGGAVALSCRYDAGLHGPLPVCWARGRLPASGCGGSLVSDDGRQEQEGTGRFRLLVAVRRGDATLTIRNLSRADAGSYGCRVTVPGWFNDLKTHVELLVEDAPHTTSSALPWETASEPSTGHVTSTRRRGTSSSSGVTAELRGREEEVNNVNNNGSSLVLVLVLVGSVSLATAAVLIVVLTRKRLSRSAQQPVRFRSSGLQPPDREPAVENVYQMDGDADGGEYESCP